MWWKILLAGIVIFAISIGLLFGLLCVAKELADFIFGKGHYKEKEGDGK